MDKVIICIIIVILINVNVLCYSDDNNSYNAKEYYNKAVACDNKLDYDCSIRYYNEAIKLAHDFPEAHQNLGGNYDSIGEYEKSLHHHKLSLSFSNDDNFRSGALTNIALVENRIMTISATYNESKLQYIIGLMERSLVISPGHLKTLRNLGLLYSNIGSYQKSLVTFIDLLYYYPKNGLALLNIGNYYFRLYDFASSTYFYKKATENAETIFDRISSMNNVAQSYRERTTYAKSILVFKKTISIINNHSYEMTFAEKDSMMTYTMINSYAVKLISCDWQSLELYELYLSKFILSQSVAFNAQSRIRTTFDELFGDEFNYMDPYTFTLFRFSSLHAELSTCELACELLGYKLIDEWNSTLNYKKGDAHGLLRIGYISHDWRNHPMGRLTKWLVTHHNDSKFNTTLISYGPDDKSDIRKYVESNSNFIDIFAEKNDFTATRLVHNMNLDILIDITMHTFNGRVQISASKPAPIVINYLGFPGTSGCKGYDYIMMHPLLIPPEFSFNAVSEKIIYLPDLYQSNYMPRDRDLTRCITASDCRHKLSITHRDGPIFCSFNAFKKVEPFVFSTWMNILRRTQNALLLLLVTDTSDNFVEDNIKMQALYHGISSSRLIFLHHLPWIQHLERAGACDLVLDTFVYGAHTTSTDMLWMWVPILALRSWGHGRIPSRVASSIVDSLIINDNDPKRKHSENVLKTTLVTSVNEYEDVAIRVGSVRSYTDGIHNAIGQLVLHRPTFDFKAMEISIESAYQSVWETYAIKNLNDDTSNIRKMSHILIPKRLVTEKLSDIMSISIRDKNYDTITNTNINNEKSRRVKYFDEETFEDCNTIKNDDFFTLVVETYTGDKILSGLLLFCLQTKPLILLKALDRTVNELGVKFDSNTKCKMIDFLFSLWSKQLYIKSIDYLYLNDASPSIYFNNSHDLSEYLEILSPLLNHLRAAAIPGYVLSPIVIKNMERELSLLNDSDKATIINDGVAYSTQLLFEQGVCTFDKGSVDLALSLHVSSILNSGNDINADLNNNVLKNLGLMLQSSSFDDIGFLILNEAMLRLQLSTSSYCEANDINSMGRTIVVFYCHEYGNEWWPNFGPSSVGPNAKGVGGSEESVIYIARELSSMGYDVRVYADPLVSDIGTESIGSGSLTWQHYSCFDIMQEMDVFISWRYAASIMLGLNAKKRFLWLHDLIDPYVFPRIYWDKVTGIFVQSEFHKQYVLNLQYTSSNDNVFVVPNGVFMTNQCHGPNHNDIFVYGSSPNRGLEQVLRVWPLIKRHIPTAVLEVYYGFTSSVDNRLGQQFGSLYMPWKQEILKLLEQEGVVYMQSVDHNTLMTAYARSGWVLYPTRYHETGCITLMKAMACGSIPITSRYTDSVLFNLTNDYDMGPDNVLNITISTNETLYDQWIYEDWLPSVLRVSTYSYQDIKKRRKKMKKYGRLQSWERSATIMSSYFI